jgi:hypothetical protein
MSEVKKLLGKVMAKVERLRGYGDSDRIEFTTTAGERYALFHDQDCCENVTIEDIAGDLADLVGSPIVQAEENTSDDSSAGAVARTPESEDYAGDESFTWTFYKLGTAKGFVTIRWYGESNGYYSESVDFERVEGDDDAT